MKYEDHFSVLDELTDDISNEIKKDALAIDRGVVLATPVDTGRAQGNWLVSIGRPDSLSLPNVKKDHALSQGQAVILGQTGFQTIYIQNNLPYINKLNSGSSEQAPTKFIDQVVERVADA